MNFRGSLEKIMQDVKNGGFEMQFHVAAIPSGTEKLLEESDLSISVVKWRGKRSLSANAYYWVLVGKISEITGLTNAAVHNKLLRRYGTPETIGGELITTFVPNTEEAEMDILNKEIYHLKPTSFTKTGKDGQVFRAYVLMKGSSDFDTKEMSRLIDGTIDEAKDLGIDTISTEEVRRMMEDYAKHYGH